MDTIAFTIALGVGVAVMAWFVLNEEKKGGGALGLFAIRAGDAARSDAASAGAVRYRSRERLMPAQGARLRNPNAAKAYRVKSPGRPSYRSFPDGAARSDTDH